MLTTKLFCGKCESFMVDESGTSNTEHYYKCVKSKKRCGCVKKAVRKDWIEYIVIAQIKKIIFDNDAIEDITDIVMEVQLKENVTLPMLQKQLSDIERDIDNILNAIQDGIHTPSTKQRLTDIEERRDELLMMIAQEEIKKPLLSRKRVKFWFQRISKLDTTKLEYEKRLINTFVNAVIVYDDGLKFVLNYKDGAKTVTFKELEESSDLFAFALTNCGFDRRRIAVKSDFIVYHVLFYMEVKMMTRDLFKLIHSELIMQVQLIENDLRLIYAAMKSGDFDENLDYLDKANLGMIIKELRKLDCSDGSPDLKDSDYKLLDEIREIRNYWCHQCYIDYVYISDDAKRENKFQEIANRLHYDENRTWDLHERMEKLRVKSLKKYKRI